MMGKWCLHASSFIFDRIIIKVAGNPDRHKSSVEFDLGRIRPLILGLLDLEWRKMFFFFIAIWSKTFSWIWDSSSSGSDKAVTILFDLA